MNIDLVYIALYALRDLSMALIAAGIVLEFLDKEKV